MDNHIYNGCAGGDKGSESECLNELLPASQFPLDLDGDCPGGEVGVFCLPYESRHLDVDRFEEFAPVPEGMVQFAFQDESLRLGQ